jgi:hypothetical protein
MKSSYRRLTWVNCIVVVIAVDMTTLNAAHPDSRTEQKVREAMQYNFDACNREDIEATMDSCADAMPDRPKFREETLKTFQEKDIHYSLVECELLQVRLPYASARIVQDTLVLDRDSKDEADAGFRNSSALLPKGERVEYVNTFKKENGKWKLYLIISDMKPVVSKQAEKAAE